MTLRVYHAGDGDCLLITDATGTRTMLVDGGRTGTFKDFKRDDLTMNDIDVICVSHIDNDHISGILQLLDDEVAWRRHDFLTDVGEPSHEPGAPRPPKIKEIWHNALFELVGADLVLPIENALATSSQILRKRGLEDQALSCENIALGERAGLELARRVSPEQLDIELNKAANGGLLTREEARGRRFERMRVKVIGPSQADIDRLRVVWKKWIEDNPTALDELREGFREDEAFLGAATPGTSIAADLGDGASSITAPNLASIMLVLEEHDESILLTGDGGADEIIAGMEAENELRKNRSRHVTVFKIPHHGALANMTEELARRVTADHYVFCGNGAHHNPELELLERLTQIRLHEAGPDRPFTFWFSSASNTPGLTDKRQKHMKRVETLMDELEQDSGGRLTTRFMTDQGFLDVL